MNFMYGPKAAPAALLLISSILSMKNISGHTINNVTNNRAFPRKTFICVCTNSTNNKFKQDNQSKKDNFMNNYKSQKNKEERFSREVSQMQNDIANVLRKFS